MNLSTSLFAALAVWLTINVVTYVMFVFDKRAAQNGRWRVSEAALLTLAFWGGTIGAKVAQRRMRHKTRKQPFASQLNLLFYAHIAVAIAILVVTYLGLWGQIFGDLATVFEAIFSGERSDSRPMPRRFGPGS